MSGSLLSAAETLDRAFAWRGGRMASRRELLADASALAARLPGAGFMLNLSVDRYRFAVGLVAALMRGHTSLLPPNQTPDTLARLQALFPSAYAVVDRPVSSTHALPAGMRGIANDDERVPDASQASPHLLPTDIDDDFIVAHVLTSGSTGMPAPHAKRWGALVRNAHAESARLADAMGRASLRDVTLVATVPAQHMYGFESTVLLALVGGAAFESERPFFPADIAAALARAPRPRMLVTTPFHLKTLLDAAIELPPVDLVLSATAALAPQLAARAETALHAPLVEIYGCTEAGQIATRRTTEGADWLLYDGLALEGDREHVAVHGGHVGAPTPLADVIAVNADRVTFRLIGRSNDLVNIAGKRSSLSHLSFQLNRIEGVADGAFWMPPHDDAELVRLVAFVVAPTSTREQLIAALRDKVDAAFLPRRVVFVDALPRDATGKLTSTRFEAWASGLCAAKDVRP